MEKKGFSLLFHFTPWLKICPQLVTYPRSCPGEHPHGDGQRKLVCPNDLQTIIVVNGRLWPWAGCVDWAQTAGGHHWGAMQGPKWESGELGSVSILQQRLESGLLWATCNMGYSCPSNVLTDCRSILFLEFQLVFCLSPTVSVLEYPWEVLYTLRKTFSAKTQVFEISKLAVWTQKFQVIQYTLCDYRRLWHHVYLLFITAATQKIIRKCHRNSFSQMYYETFVFNTSSCLERVGKLIKGEDDLV